MKSVDGTAGNVTRGADGIGTTMKRVIKQHIMSGGNPDHCAEYDLEEGGPIQPSIAVTRQSRAAERRGGMPLRMQERVGVRDFADLETSA